MQIEKGLDPIVTTSSSFSIPLIHLTSCDSDRKTVRNTVTACPPANALLNLFGPSFWLPLLLFHLLPFYASLQCATFFSSSAHRVYIRPCFLCLFLCRKHKVMLEEHSHSTVKNPIITASHCAILSISPFTVSQQL